MPDDRTYTAAEVDAAVEAISDPERLKHAQEVVAHAAPALQRILDEALHAGGYFGAAHDAQVTDAAQADDLGERITRVRTLVAEEVRLGMLVGATVGFELARQLRQQDEEA